MKKILSIISFIFAILVIFINSSSAQNPQDCVGAITVCQDTYWQASTYSGIGNVNDIPSGYDCPITCMYGGEKNSVWYTFQVQQSGWLDFRIQPHINEDYDWALFNLTTHDCSALQNPTLLQQLEVSCNWTAQTGITGANSLSPNSGSHCVGSSGAPNNPRIWVNVGEIYYLNVSNWTGGSGYKIDFTNSTAQIYDNTAPSFVGINTNIACGSNTITVYFSENVACSSVTPSSFEIIAEDGTQHTVTSVYSSNCSQGGAMDNEFVITVSPPITSGGTYNITLVEPLEDMCGNVSDDASFSFFIAHVSCEIVDFLNPDCGASNGAIQVQGVYGSGSYTYEWSHDPSLNSNFATDLAAGTYTVTIHDGACSSTCEITLDAGDIPELTTSSTPATCGAANGTASVNATGNDPFTYQWSTSPVQTTQTATGLSGGTYVVTVTDNNGCSATASVVVGASDDLDVSLNANNSVCVDNSGSISTTVNGEAPFSYSWSNGATSGTISNLPAGTYTVTVTDANSCTATASATIQHFPGPEIDNVDIVHANCGLENGYILIEPAMPAALGIEFEWNTTPTQYSPGIQDLAPGSYTVTITDINGCSITETYTIDDNPGPEITQVDIEDANCGNADGSIEISYTSTADPTTISWNTNPPQSTNSISDLAPGTYEVIITDANGCTTTGAYSILNIPGPSISNSSITHATCGQSNGGVNIVINSTESLTYQWNSNPQQNTQNLSDVPAGSYTVTVTDEAGCSTTATYVVNNTSGPELSSTSFTNATCSNNNGSATINVSGGTNPISYQWNTTPAQTTNTASNLEAGTYVVTVTDGTGCTITSTYTISDLAGPTITSIDKIDEVCDGMNGSATVIYNGGNGNINIVWNTIPPQTTTTINNLDAGTYQVTIKDTNNCEAIETVTIINHAGPTIESFTSTDELCDEVNGSITVNYTGGIEPISFQWSTEHNTQTISNLTEGTYAVTITDQNSCTAQAIHTIVNHPKPDLEFTNIVMDTCLLSSGKVTAFVSGGSGVYSYLWDTEPAQNSSSATGLDPGTYIVVVSDGFCTISDTIEIIGIPGPDAAFNISPNIAPISHAEIRFTDMTEGEIETWHWEFGDGFQSTNQNPKYTYQNLGEYEVTMIVTDINGCIDTAYGTVLIDIDFNIWIPNAFTPNDDGKNDRWGPVAIGFSDKDYQMKIWDRWGMLVFETDNYYQRWDGSIRDRDVENDISTSYVYEIIIYDNMGKRHRFFGRVTLIY
ncbi:MAG: PKD domain-containing protein [Bacteroidales bacterium]